MAHFVVEKGLFNMDSATLLNKPSISDFYSILSFFCVMFSTKESKVDTNLKTSLLSSTELSHKTQQKACVVGGRKFLISPLPVLTENNEKHLFKT